MRELEKITDLIVKISPVYISPEDYTDVNNTPNDWIYELLEDKTVDNEQKAGVLMGTA